MIPAFRLGFQRLATVARLAVDEALARGDRKTALARATRGHVSLAEVAARALLLEQKEIAGAIAGTVVDADPGASGAQMVKAALKGQGPAPGKGRIDAMANVTDQPPEICALVFADRLATAAGSEVARAWLARITRTPMAPRDPLAGPLAVDLAARGVLPIESLPAELRASVQRAHAAEARRAVVAGAIGGPMGAEPEPKTFGGDTLLSTTVT